MLTLIHTTHLCDVIVWMAIIALAQLQLVATACHCTTPQLLNHMTTEPHSARPGPLPPVMLAEIT